ncbi:unnamed protein product [Pleuronectes platessa]|uniref:Uncharacterized protein n=1 Tax=Pleuronectes platessa TaxID=8262 RepID=A0A9N7Z0K6_PLEPL|nr:unnamed protein product [Pleuronectes platessa]
MRSTAVPSSNPFEEPAWPLVDPQPAVEVCGWWQRSEQCPASLRPACRHHPPAVVLYAGSGGAFWGPRDLNRFPVVGCGRFRGGVHSGSRSSLQRAPRDQPQVHPESHSLRAPRRRLPADVSHSPTSVVLTAASVPVRLRVAGSRLSSLILRRQRPSQVVSAPVPAPRRSFLSDVSSLLTSEVLTAAAFPVPARGSQPMSLILRLQRSSDRHRLQSLLRGGGSHLTSLLF